MGGTNDECKLVNHELTAHNMKMMVPEQKNIFGGTHVASDFNVLKDSLKEQVDTIHAETRAKLPSMGNLPTTGKDDEAVDEEDDEEVAILSVEEMRRNSAGATSKTTSE